METGTVDVAAGATLSGGGSDDAAIGVTSGPGSGTTATIEVDGAISGNRAGIVGNASAPNYGFPSTRLDITVGATGQIRGQSAIYLDANSGGSGYRTVGATLDNSGLVEGSVFALEASDNASGFLMVTNRASGVIRGTAGAILAPVSNFINAGLIDGGSGSAYSLRNITYTNFAIIPGGGTNSGVMTSSSASATIYLPVGTFQITNSGTIRNTNGYAIEATNYLTLTNAAGGLIEAPNWAVVANGEGSIVNEGTINGGVYLSGIAGWGSILNTSKGTINGDVYFGNADDTLNVSWDASTNRIGGISGVINGGGGTNTLRFDIAKNTTLDSMFGHLVMPTNFQKLGVVLKSGVTATLNGDAPDNLLIGGSGNFITTGQVTSAGAAFTQTLGPPYDYTSLLGFTNNGDIHSVFSPAGGVINYDDFAVSLSNLRSFSNTGTISVAAGNGLRAVFGLVYGASSDMTFSNSGTITADGTALVLSLNGATGSNSGLIRSTGGVGAAVTGMISNSGTISGATTGVVFNNGILSNSGAITGTTTGVQMFGGTVSNSGTIEATSGIGVDSYYGNIDNLAGGVITGSGDAIQNAYGGITVKNAGTINGNVNFAPLSSSYYAQSSSFVDRGGTVNGSVLFGSGSDTYVTDISKYADGRFSNVTGVVDGGDGQDTVVLQVASATSAKIASPTNFERVQYDLSNGLTLNLTSGDAFNKTLLLSGTGSVDLTADFSVANVQALVVTMPFGASYSDDPGALSIVSHGNLSFSETGYNNMGVSLQSTTSFENAGHITATSQYFYSPPAYAIGGGALVINSGTITVNSAAAVASALKVVNTGSILQAVDGQTSYGLYGVNNVVNTGTITTGNTAVTLNYYNYYQPAPGASLVNSGLIRSTDADAIDLYYSYGPATISNSVTGQIISDKGYAISGGGYGTTLHNEGVISGDISLYGESLIENHGTFTGRIDLNYGNSTLRLTGGTFSGSANVYGGYGRLEIAVTDTGAPTMALGTSGFTGFAELDMQAGTASMGGNYRFDKIEISGGRLIGLAGSQLAAETITVASGATFGSAGSVVGDLTVNGTLSPGASPGTMVVTGNVSLAKGSTSLFELTPTVNDKLQVSGTVTIADGAVLQLSGSPNLTPGKKLDLIVASGGIKGAFSSISGTPGNLHLIQSANGLQGLGLFSVNSSFSTQVSGIVDSLNAALIAGRVSTTLIDAMPALVNTATGESNAVALTRLTPQAYASASQLAAEDALSVVDVLRQESHFAADAGGPFAFGRAISSGRKLAGDATAGVAMARMNSSGVVSGFGYGTQSAWVSAFFGRLSGVERSPELDARTVTDTLVVGAKGQVRVHGFRLGLLTAYNNADATTRRSAPGDITATGRYTLKSWVADLDLSYRASLNTDWAFEPRLAASYIHTTRAGLTEQGGGAFGLTIMDGTSSDWFVDGQIEVQGGQQPGERLHPFASVGFITRTGGEGGSASASLSGFDVPLTVDGLDRRGTRATVGLGIRYDMSKRLTTSASFDGEFGDNGRQRLTLGLHWAF
ncbi:hypothetical protein ABENE_14000 [Asticcacaulis benevestitus DSM 16100 = ATCC BAA-896]|uniref:Autotransporter domain-containing protein n=2 Tax=Asticcacaulis TaxID=76890 RepID=V4RDK0_9CAUL|nr:hypothetical protein ABENE_14000 [Asticcacaulis benevestitus DSM 16100 = ATCC BAA-896]